MRLWTGVEMPLYYSGRPRVIVKSAGGYPMKGKYCTIREVGETASDLNPLILSYKCGPSDSNGIMFIEDLSITGGSSRMLHLEVLVGGVVAPLSSESFWHPKSKLYYVSDA